MSTQSVKGASVPSASAIEWHSVDWVRVHRNVEKLQTRIVKATQAGDWRRVKALQRFLTRSFSGKALAVKRVTENRGKDTPGVDGEVWSSSPDAKTSGMCSLSRRGYKPQPLRRVHIPKSNGKKRPLGIPTMRDRAMQALYLLALQPVAETLADRNSFGFRPERSTADAMEQCFNGLAQKRCAQWILEGDIRGCFDNINHDWLIANVPMDAAILRKWLKAGYIESKRLFPTKAGTPQGGIISPTLANMALDGLERELEAKFGVKGTRNAERNKVNLARYADDFIITGSSQELLENEVKPLVAKFLATRGLELSEEKTRVTHIDKGFDFLGQTVRKFKGTLLIKPSKKSVNVFLDKVREEVKANKTAKQVTLIRRLNPIIRGWANFHRSVVASETFAKVDSVIWRLLWQWACRRHPNKGRRWIKERYFDRTGSRNWVFRAETGTVLPDGQPEMVKLVQASDIKIRRHTKIKGGANPFDPQWFEYFEQRNTLKMQNNLKWQKRAFELWLNQDGKCVICCQPITIESGWHKHHLIRRADGGSDAPSNKVLLHRNCHRQVHSLGLEVVKPA